MCEYFNNAHIRDFFAILKISFFNFSSLNMQWMSSEKRIRGWSYRKPLPLAAWGLLSTTMEFLSTTMEFLFTTTMEFLSTTMEFLSTMTKLQDTMMVSRCNTIYNGTPFNGFLEWESRFTLRLNTAKSTSYNKKCFRQKQSKIKFSTKKQQTHISMCLSSGARGSKDLHSHSSDLYRGGQKSYNAIPKCTHVFSSFLFMPNFTGWQMLRSRTVALQMIRK